MYFVYIIYSGKIDRYYIGFTQDIEARIKKHNSNHDEYTGKKGNWELKYQEEFTTKEGAYASERQIKKWKSRKLIENLIQKNANKEFL